MSIQKKKPYNCYWLIESIIFDGFLALINLGVMAATHIPCDFPYFPIPYGCWCGITLPWPSPYKPIDDLDVACKTHDWCYEDAVDSGCSIFDEYVFNYKWHDDNGEVRILPFR